MFNVNAHLQWCRTLKLARVRIGSCARPVNTARVNGAAVRARLHGQCWRYISQSENCIQIVFSTKGRFRQNSVAFVAIFHIANKMVFGMLYYIISSSTRPVFTECKTNSREHGSCAPAFTGRLRAGRGLLDEFWARQVGSRRGIELRHYVNRVNSRKGLYMLRAL